MESRPCGIRYTEVNNAYRVEELIQIALERKLIRNVSEGKKLKFEELCKLLDLPLYVEKEEKEKIIKGTKSYCRTLSKEKIIVTFAKELLELNITETEAIELEKEDLCELLFPTIKRDFDIQKCGGYNQRDLINYGRTYGVPIDLKRNNIEKTCEQLDKGINQKYTTTKNNNWKESDCFDKGNVSLLPHQKAVVNHLINHRSCLAVHDVGTGKTITAIASIQCLKTRYPDLRVIVLTPSSLINNFLMNCKQYGIDERDIEIYSYDQYYSFCLRSQEKPPRCTNRLVIVDEAHNLRSLVEGTEEITKSKRANEIMKCISQAFRVLLLTATPFVNDFSDIINIKMMLDGQNPDMGRISEKHIKYLVDNPRRFIDEFKCKVSVYFPEKNQANYPRAIFMPDVKFEMTEKYYNKYKSIENKNADPSILFEIKTTKNSTRFYSTLRRAVNSLDGDESTENPKIKWVVDFILSEAKEGRKSLVYSNWIAAGMNLIRKKLDEQNEIKYAYVSGEMDGTLKSAFVKEYNDNKAPILLISKAGAEGLNLLETRNVILLESNWNPSMDNQIIGRAIRLNSHKNLPYEEQTVKIFRTKMVKPEGHLDTLESVDELLYDICKNEKEPKSKELLKLLKISSIESETCNCKKTQEGTCVYVTSKTGPIKGKSKHVEIDPFDIFSYKTEQSALVKPTIMTSDKYETIANIKEEKKEEEKKEEEKILIPKVEFFDDEWDTLLTEIEEETV